MKKLDSICAALAVAAFCAGAPSPALAESEFLEDGVPITAAKASQMTGEMLLEDMAGGTDMLCSAIFDGEVGPGKADKITEVLSLAGVGNGNGITCTLDAKGTCEEANGSELSFPLLNLPWRTELNLVGTRFDDQLTNAGANVGYLFECHVFGIKIDNGCFGSTFTILENTAEGLAASFTAESTALRCSADNGEDLLEGSYKLTLANGLALTVS